MCSDLVAFILFESKSCGDVMKLQIRVEDGTVVDAKFKTFGCGSAIASSSYATEVLIGSTIDDAQEINNSDIAAHLKLPPDRVCYPLSATFQSSYVH